MRLLVLLMLPLLASGLTQAQEIDCSDVESEEGKINIRAIGQSTKDREAGAPYLQKLMRVCPSPVTTFNEAPAYVHSLFEEIDDFKRYYCATKAHPASFGIINSLDNNNVESCVTELRELKEDYLSKVPVAKAEFQDTLSSLVGDAELKYELGVNFFRWSETHDYTFEESSYMYGSGSAEFPVKRWIRPTIETRELMGDTAKYYWGLSADDVIQEIHVELALNLPYSEAMQACDGIRVNGAFANSSEFAPLATFNEPGIRKLRVYFSKNEMVRSICEESELSLHRTRRGESFPSDQLLNTQALAVFHSELGAGNNVNLQSFIEGETTRVATAEAIQVSVEALQDIMRLCPSPASTLVDGSYARPRLFQIADLANDYEHHMALAGDVVTRLERITPQCVSELQEISRQFSEVVGEAEAAYEQALASSSSTPTILGLELNKALPEGVEFDLSGRAVIYLDNGREGRVVTSRILPPEWYDLGRPAVSLFLDSVEGERPKLMALHVRLTPESFGGAHECSTLTQAVVSELEERNLFFDPTYQPRSALTTGGRHYLGRNVMYKVECENRGGIVYTDIYAGITSRDKPDFRKLALHALTQ